MRLYFAKVSNKAGKCGLSPCDADSIERVRKMGDGEIVCCEVVQPRSVPHHRMYWGLMRMIGVNQDPQRDEDSIDAEVRILAGHYEVLHLQGHEVRVPKRIAFHKMTRDQWQQYWRRVEMAVSERFGAEYLEELGLDTRAA